MLKHHVALLRMSDIFEHYFSHCLDGFTSSVLPIAALYALLSIIFGFFKGRDMAYSLLLLGCCLLIVYLTVLSRLATERVKLSIVPFSCYQAIADGDLYMIPQIIMNVVMFLPLGFFLKGLFVHWDWKKVVACGAMFSMAIELLQLVLQRGTAELDDLIHNTLGCYIGVLIFMGVKKVHGLIA